MAKLDRALYRLFLRLYPADFRREHARELEDIYAWCLDVERRRGRRALGRWRAGADAIRGAIALRARVEPRPRARSSFGAVQDLRSAGRAFRRTPAFTGGLILVLALGIGANAAVFTLIQAVLLEPLPYRDPGRLAAVYRSRPDNPELGYGATKELALGLREHAADVIETASVLLWDGNLESEMDLLLADRAERIHGAFVTPNFFQVLGVDAQLGRVFSPADETPVSNPIVVSDAFWRRMLEADPGVVGRSVTLVSGRRDRRARSMTVVGVLTPRVRFTYPETTDVWALQSWSDVARQPSGAILFKLYGRLKPGVSREQAVARLEAIDDEVFTAAYRSDRWRLGLQPLSDLVAGTARPAMLLLAAVSGLLLLVTCVTVANGLLVRVAERRRELALRASLGASRGRLIRQLVTEGLLLSIAGTAAGALLASLTLPLFRALVPATMARADEMRVDGWMLVFAAGIAAVVTVLAAVLPAIQASRVDLVTALKQASGASAATAVVRSRAMLVGAQAAIATALLIGAALLLVSFSRLGRVDLGFSADDVVTAEMRLIGPIASDENQISAFRDEVLANVRALPGVIEAGVTTAVPFRGVDFSAGFDPPGCEVPPGAPVRPGCEGRSVGANTRTVDTAFFSIMRVPLRLGRVISPDDTRDSQPVVVISEDFARLMYGDENPIGRTLDFRGDKRIVGVVGPMRYGGFDRDPRPAIYLHAGQEPSELICLVIRTAPGTVGLAAGIQRAVHAVDSSVPAMKIATIDQILNESIADRRFYTATTVVFAGLAMVLTAAGLIVVVSRSVVERRRELAIRSTLGARHGALVALLTRQGLWPALIGTAAGLVAAWIGATLIEQFLFGVGPRAGWVYAGAGLLTIAIASIACVVPASRLSRMAPSVLLRE